MLTDRWCRFWFAPESPTSLGIGRIIFFGSMFAYYWQVDYRSFADVPSVFFEPMLLFRVLHVPILPSSALWAVSAAWKLSLLMACIGLGSRMSIAAAFLMGIYLLGLPHNFGKINHSDAILIFCMGVLTFSRCGDAWSIDRLKKRWKDVDYSHGSDPAPHGEYRWPLRMIWTVSVLVFLAAAVAKLRHSGIAWITSDNLGLLLVRHQYSHDPISDIGLVVARYPVLVSLLAAGSVAVEVLMPLALFSRIMRWILVPSIFLMQFGIGAMMGVWFTQFFISYTFWIPWSAPCRPRCQAAVTTIALTIRD